MTDHELLEAAAHLRDYGYAPGHYMNTCLACKQMMTNVDKRAFICRPCAEARHAFETKRNDSGKTEQPIDE